MILRYEQREHTIARPKTDAQQVWVRLLFPSNVACAASGGIRDLEGGD